MAETVFVWESEPCIASQKVGQETGRCKAFSVPGKGVLVRALIDDLPEVTQFLQIEHICRQSTVRTQKHDGLGKSKSRSPFILTDDVEQYWQM